MNSQSLSSTFTTSAHIENIVGQKAIALYQENLIFMQIIAVLITGAFVVGTIWIIIKIGWFSTRVNRVRDVVLKTDMPKQNAKSAWATAQQHFFDGNPNDLKIAIMEADNILNDALRYAGIEGSGLGERLKNIKHGQIPNIQDIWDAHKLRNDIAHETNYSLKRDAAERALETYHAALKNLGIFDDEE